MHPTRSPPHLRTTAPTHPPPLPQKPTIFAETPAADDDDIDVEEASSPAGGFLAGPGAFLAPGVSRTGSGAGGKLARDLAGAGEADVDRGEEDEDGDGGGVRLGSRRPGGVGAGDLTAMQEGVQRLNKAAQPLGRAMDFLQEDIDGMVKEASFW